MRDEIFCVMLLMYGHVLHEKRRPLVLFSISNRLPHVGQKSSITKSTGRGRVGRPISGRFTSIERSYWIKSKLRSSTNANTIKTHVHVRAATGEMSKQCRTRDILPACLKVATSALHLVRIGNSVNKKLHSRHFELKSATQTQSRAGAPVGVRVQQSETAISAAPLPRMRTMRRILHSRVRFG